MKQSDRITEMHTDIKWMKKQLFGGNGTKGIIDKVTSNTNWRYITTGGLIVLSALVGWGLTILF